MRWVCVAVGVLLGAFCASSAYAGDPLIDLHVAIGASQADTDMTGDFAITGLKAGKYDVILTGNPVKSYLDAAGGHRISLVINGKRLPLGCSQDGCKAKAVPLQGTARGKVTLAD
jgi:hypothetical protein